MGVGGDVEALKEFLWGTMMMLYRVESRKEQKITTCSKFKTMRVPRNVPYVVDNLWEWKRPDGYPCRRHSVYASPTPELAKESGLRDGQLYQVEFKKEVNCLIGQLGNVDSKNHPDCQKLPKLLFKLLGQGWIDASLAEKEESGRLGIPCLRKEEVELLFHSESLALIRDQVWDEISYWTDVRIVSPDAALLPYPHGEIFIEAEEWNLVLLRQ